MADRDALWEAEVKIRRNGRIYRWERAHGDSPGNALYAVTNDLEREFFGDGADIEAGEQP